jgi:hypothetical protein
MKIILSTELVKGVKVGKMDFLVSRDILVVPNFKNVAATPLRVIRKN